MNGYSEVINVIGAIIVFSMILLSANSMIIRNGLIQVEGELEQEVISLGQEIIDEALSKSFDAVTHNATVPPTLIPGGFTAPGGLGPGAGETTRADFNDFDDYDGWSDTFTTTHGDFDISARVFYVNEVTGASGVSFAGAGTQTTYKKIEVIVTNRFLTDNRDEVINYTLEFVRNYYAD